MCQRQPIDLHSEHFRIKSYDRNTPQCAVKSYQTEQYIGQLLIPRENMKTAKIILVAVMMESAENNGLLMCYLYALFNRL